MCDCIADMKFPTNAHKVKSANLIPETKYDDWNPLEISDDTKKMIKDNEENTTVLYEDKFCKVIPDQVVIKRYYMPLKTAKAISLRDIRVLFHERQSHACNQHVGRQVNWGMAMTPVFWAKDLHRTCCFLAPRKTNVVVQTDSIIRKGFTVEDIEKFLDVIKGQIGDGVLVQNGTPY